MEVAAEVDPQRQTQFVGKLMTGFIRWRVGMPAAMVDANQSATKVACS